MRARISARRTSGSSSSERSDVMSSISTSSCESCERARGERRDEHRVVRPSERAALVSLPPGQPRAQLVPIRSAQIARQLPHHRLILQQE
jgi:hypothetical protein